MRGYTSYNVYSRAADNRACSGVSILVKNSIPQVKVPITSNLQCIAVRVSLHKSFTICNIYVPPSQSFSTDDLEHVISQLPGTFMLVGDFNAHHIILGNNYTTSKVNEIDKFVSQIP